MTIFIAHAPADQKNAEALERALERRGFFVELDDGETALRPVAEPDVVALIVSAGLTAAQGRLRLAQRALDAWSAGRLVLVTIDGAAAPMGLRDLPVVRVAAAAGEGRWQEAAQAVAEAQDRPAQRAAVHARHSQGGVRIAVALGLAVAGLAGAGLALWAARMSGAALAGWADLPGAIEALGAPADAAPWLLGAVCGLALAIAGALAARRPRARKGAGPYIAHAPADAAAVAPLLEGAQTGAAPEAIEAASAVLAIGSRAGFDDDGVLRALYLADRAGKPLVSVLIEDVAPPQDFHYYLAGAPVRKMFETPEAERPEAFAALIGAAA